MDYNMSSHLFKVGNVQRTKKVLVIAKGETNIYEQVVEKASKKLDIDGASLVLEKDGTLIDTDEELLLIKNELLTVLQKDQLWLPENSASGNNSIILTDTLTVSSTENINLEEEEENTPPLIVIDHNSEMYWRQFEIWKDIPTKVIENLEKGVRAPSLTNEVVRIVVSNMRAVRTMLPCKAFRIIAARMVSRYTTSFQSHDEDNVVLGNGFEALYTKLQDRNNYLNRPNKRTHDRPQTSNKKMKLMANSRVGCPNWLPEDNEESRDKVRLLQNIHQDDPHFKDYIRETYGAQRQFINSGKEIFEIYDEWPALFTEKGILIHFEILTCIKPYEVPIIQKAKKIITFGQEKNINILPDEGVLMSAFKILGQHFKEDITTFIYQVKDLQLETSIKILAPCIIELESDGAKTYYIQVENKRIGPESSFEKTFLMAFAMYFNFGLCYPKQCACTFEFIQRYAFKIHQESGSKSLTKNVKNKVFNLITRIANLKS